MQNTFKLGFHNLKPTDGLQSVHGFLNYINVFYVNVLINIISIFLFSGEGILKFFILAKACYNVQKLIITVYV